MPNTRQAAAGEARRARRMAAVWWAQMPLVCGGYMLVSPEPLVVRAMGAYIAGASIIALAVTYSAKAESADAKAEASD